jgi:hypothetical protein
MRTYLSIDDDVTASSTDCNDVLPLSLEKVVAMSSQFTSHYLEKGP